MAYDEHGRYYFDPEVDAQDADALENVDRTIFATEYRQRQAEALKAQKRGNEITGRILKKHGLSQED
jgi:hypothetical protein